jgi:CysZ protein
MVIGLVPGAITALILASAFVALAVWVDDWARGITGAITNDSTPNGLLVALVGLAILGAGTLLAIYTFTALTLLIGQPFFEAIADRIAPQAGLHYTDAEEPWWRSTLRGMRDGVVLLSIGAAFGIGMFLLGLVPFVGAALAFVGASVVGGSLLTLELTAYPLSRVGVIALAERRRIVAARRPLAMGFGVAAYLVCLVPFGAVVAMPALVAGGTLLAARLVEPASTVVSGHNGV